VIDSCTFFVFLWCVGHALFWRCGVNWLLLIGCVCRPTPRVEWTRGDGKPWHNRIRVTPRGHGTEIEIMNVDVDDEGIYRCTATNRPDGPVASADIRLLVHCNNTHTHTHTHAFNGPLSGTTRVSRYQKGKTNLAGPILSVFFALIVHSELKSVHPRFPVAFNF